MLLKPLSKVHYIEVQLVFEETFHSVLGTCSMKLNPIKMLVRHLVVVQ